MPPTASRVSDQFVPTTANGTSQMVLCAHCHVQKLPKNSLQRKEEHLRSCASFALSPLATERDATGKTMLEESIGRRAGRTKPGNSRGGDGRAEVLRLQRIGAALGFGDVGQSEGIQERVERILRGEGLRRDDIDEHGTSAYQSPDMGGGGYTPFPPASFENNETMAALLSSATRATPTNAGNINPRKRPLPTDLHDTASPSNLLPISQHLSNMHAASTSPQPPSNEHNKRLKHAELYLDEADFDFVCSAQTPREERFAALVERLARLVRLRDMR